MDLKSIISNDLPLRSLFCLVEPAVEVLCYIFHFSHCVLQLLNFFLIFFSTGSTDFSPGFVSRVLETYFMIKELETYSRTLQAPVEHSFPNAEFLQHEPQLQALAPTVPMATAVHSIQHHPKTIRFPGTFFRQFC